MDRLRDRFTPDRYADDEPVKVGALGDEHHVPERLFTRTQQIAAAYELHLLPVLDIYTRTELTREQCHTLADELTFIRDLIADPLLDQHLGALLALADACRHSPEPAMLTVEGP